MLSDTLFDIASTLEKDYDFYCTGRNYRLYSTKVKAELKTIMLKIGELQRRLDSFDSGNPKVTIGNAAEQDFNKNNKAS